MLYKESMDRRGFLLSGLAALVALSTPNIVDKGVEMVARAEAKDKIVYTSIGDYYDSGTPSDVMHGARQCSADKIMDQILGFEDNQWMQLYFGNEYGQNLQAFFKEIDGKKITINSPLYNQTTVTFDFGKFHTYLLEHKDCKFVGLWYDGFMSIGSSDNALVIPIDSSIVYKIEKL